MVLDFHPFVLQKQHRDTTACKGSLISPLVSPLFSGVSDNGEHHGQLTYERNNLKVFGLFALGHALEGEL